ncbi:MAG: DsrE family protein [Candidatus Bathyarchaeia archaeon]
MASEDQSKKLAIIVHSGDYERLHHALSIALAGVTNALDCHMFIAYDALRKLTKAEIDKIPPDTNFRRPLRKLIQQAKETGNLHLYACGSSMGIQGIARTELVEEFDEVLGLSAFLSLTEGAAFTFFI